ncbi:sterol desaturase/sphingolipid hydroxylase (fatty acid hydroxylase superfamily) [Flavobacterium sp. CG_23.5]|uniref:sterol desaturase family protein n=1 Tax=unclassified Flavobacterium TaxID=196869 RepID=UPI0018C90266|nr:MULTISPECIES: sterol desaturase family protein [unclassified Flavobacterium]MBG6109721.1 sterol desaturase/sphingolipid hydroxylase (fatty acid hydroxylase superfamily) [Flavobacterium sp. CG_9.10]MBP2284755.1 sterol desaturase/sphingolipid hydroxylase (fatty acid hydroxylase superfamily) [Flavobacterium sp. CG_23.5]
MDKYIEIIKNSYSGYFNYLIDEILYWKWDNYFYGLIAISLFVWLLEIIFPWRKQQAIFRKDFWLDLFYLFFNFFLLNLILLIALSNIVEQFSNNVLQVFGLELTTIQLFSISTLPKPLALFIFFIISDFIQWNVHRLLHTIPFLWKIHKTHHSVKEMGFAAHFRYNWMEPIVYRSILYIPIILIGGVNLEDVFIVHFMSIAIGHLNHANLGWDYGFLKYIFNNPKMHIWHHSKKIPTKYGVNFGISLSIWDYIFKTHYIPKDGRDIELGFEDENEFPNDFIKQEIYPLIK